MQLEIPRLSRAARRKRSATIAVGVVVAAVMLVSCSGEAPEPTASVSAGTTTDPDATIRFAAYSIPTTMDPHKTSGLIQNPVLFLAYDRLIHLTPDAERVPGLATSWEYADDGMSLTLELRPDVVYQDGEPFDAQSVKANIERAKTVTGTAVALYLQSVESVDVVDDLTVRLNLNQLDYTVPDSLALDAGAMVCPSMFDDDSLANTACGAGMYKQEGNLDPNTGASFVRWDGYWDPDSVAAAEVDVSVITDDNTRFAALQAGQADVIGILPSQIDQAESGGFGTHATYEAAYVSILVNPDVVTPLKDPRVRKAVSLAIDREAIVQAVARGQGQATIQPVSTNNPSFNEDAPDPVRDADAARELLEEAGYPDGFDLGTVYHVGGALRESTLSAIAGQLSEVGITMGVQTITFAELVSEFYTNKTMGASYSTTGAGLTLGSGVIAANLPNSSFNPGHVEDPEFTALFDSSLAEPDPDARNDIYKEMSGFIAEQPLNAIPIYFPISGYATNDNVVGMQTPKLGINFLEWRGIGISG